MLVADISYNVTTSCMMKAKRMERGLEAVEEVDLLLWMMECSHLNSDFESGIRLINDMTNVS